MIQPEQGLQEFDALASLAQSDPVAFEALRLATIERYIQQAPLERQPRLRCLQWRIEQERLRAKTPLGACVRIVAMMMDRVLAENGLVDQLEQLSTIVAHDAAATRCAKIIAVYDAELRD